MKNLRNFRGDMRELFEEIEADIKKGRLLSDDRAASYNRVDAILDIQEKSLKYDIELDRRISRIEKLMSEHGLIELEEE